MTLPSRRIFRASCCLAALALGAPLAVAQQAGHIGTEPLVTATDRLVLGQVQGRVVDLITGKDGTVIYASAEGEVGEFEPRVPRGMRRTVHALPGQIPTADELRAIARDKSGRLCVIDEGGDIFRLESGVWNLVYNDLYMILDPTDLVVDAENNFIVASATPSIGQRAVNRISPDGEDWSYLFVRHSPCALAVDPTTSNLLIVDDEGPGAIRMVDTSDPSFPTSLHAFGPNFGFDSNFNDGDIAVEIDGDLWIADGDKVWFFDRSEGTLVLGESGFGIVRGLAIGYETWDDSHAAYSLYIASGEYPTKILERRGLTGFSAKASSSVGPVPDKGRFRMSGASNGLQIQTLAGDNYGDLLVGGHQYQSNFRILRYHTADKTVSQVAHQSDGLAGVIRGIAVAPDDTIYALTKDGTIQSIVEGTPPSVTTIFADPGGDITEGFGLALGLDGTYYVANRDSWAVGDVFAIAPDGSSITQVAWMAEAHGVAANPDGGLFISEWNGPGFNGTLGSYDFGTGFVTDLVGSELINFTNAGADGDLVVDVNGSIYVCSEDDWSVRRYDPGSQSFVRVGSSYSRMLTGLEIAPSWPGSGSTTGWSLYVCDVDTMYELPSVPAPAPDLVDSSVSRSLSLATGLRPEHGRPRALAGTREGLYVATATGEVARIDTETGALAPVLSTPLASDLVWLEPAGVDARYLFAASRSGDFFLVDVARGRADPIGHRAGLPHLLRTLTGAIERSAHAEHVWELDGWSLRGGPLDPNPARFPRSRPLRGR